MSSGFENLKGKRTDLDKLVKKVLDIQKDDREVQYKKLTKRQRVDNSLLWSDDKECHTIRGKIEKCRSFQKIQRGITHSYTKYHLNPFKDVPNYVGKYVNRKEVCQSLWCPNCRKFLTQMYEKKIHQRLGERLLPTKYTNDDFHHLSGVIGLCNIDDKEVLELLKKDQLKWRRVGYRLNTKIQPKDSPFIESVYEFELVDWTYLRNSPKVDFKSKQIQQLIEHQKIRGSKFLFVHFHSITNLTKDQINLVFEDEYFVGDKPLLKTNKDCGLFVQKFHSTQTLERNIEKLCSYPFKDPYRFKHNFRGSDYQNGEYFESEDLSQLIKVYQKVQKRNWRGLFRSVQHQRSVEFHKMRSWFPSDHPLWFGEWGEMKKPTIKGSDLNYINLEKVWVVDSDGNTHIEGWNPNSFFPNGLEMTIIQRHKHWIGKEEVEVRDNQGEVVMDKNDNVRMIWRNKYKYDDDTYIKRRVTLEEHYYPKEHKLLKKDQYITMNFSNGRYYKEWKNGDGGKDLDVLGWSDIPKDIEFTLEDENFIRRIGNLQRLDETDRFMVSLWKYRKLKLSNGGKVKNKKEIHILF